MTTTKRKGHNAGRAMTLVEIIGVLAILVILASLILPRIQKTVGKGTAGASNAINDAQIDEVLFNLQSIKAGAMQHQARFGSLASRSGSPSYDNYDRMLLAEGLIDKPFAVRMGTHAQIRLVNVSALSASSPVNGTNGAYDLSASGRNGVIGASYLLEAVIEGVNVADARALNDRLDGLAMSGSIGDDLKGQVMLLRANSGSAELRIYITHR